MKIGNAMMLIAAMVAVSAGWMPVPGQAKTTCKYCKEVQKAKAKVCHYCRSSVDYVNHPFPTPVAVSGDIDEAPCWGPGGRIVYINTKTGHDVTTMSAIGAKPVRHQRGQDSHADAMPFWGPNNKIVFSGGTVSKNLYVMDADGSNRKRITEDDTADEATPTMNAQGTIIFRSDVGQRGESGYNLFSVDINGGNLTKLTKDGTFNNNPCWSPDGKKIAFNRFIDDNQDVYVMDADGSNIKRLTTNPKADYDPSWGPDGRIAFVSERDGEQFDRDKELGEIYIMNSDGTGQKRLTWNRWRDRRPSLGEGGKILFESSPNYGAGKNQLNSIFMITAKK